MWLVPTRRRLSKLRNFCESALNAETSTPAMLIVDHSDWLDNHKAYEKIDMPDMWDFVHTDAIGMGPKVREVWPLLAEDCFWVGILNDDHFIVTKHWDTKLVNQINGKNFITTNDRWNAPKRAAGATIFSMPLMEAFGFPMFPPQIDHLGIDDVFETIGRNTGCWEVDMSVIVEHHHAFKNPDTIDDTHKLVYGTKPWQDANGVLSPEAQKTQEAFNDWLQKDAPGVVARVKALRAKNLLGELPDDPAKTLPVSGCGSTVPGGTDAQGSLPI